MHLELGNAAAIEGYRDPHGPDPERVFYRPLRGDRITQVVFPDRIPLIEAYKTTMSLLDEHVEDHRAIAWVTSDEPVLAGMVACRCDARTERPVGWGRSSGADLLTPLTLLAAPLVLAGFMLALRTDAGRDLQANLMGGGQLAGAGTGAMRPADYLGITANATAPAAGNTTLAGEIASGSLLRAQATYSHTNGTASYSLTKTFTSDQTVTIAKFGVFNAAAAGVLLFETLLNQVAALVSGDQLAITESVTI